MRVMIVAKDPLARAGLNALLNQNTGLNVVAHLSTEEDLPAALDVYRPDLVLWDAGWDLLPDNLEQLNILLELSIPVVMLIPDDIHAAQILASGANGLLLRNAAPEQLAAALEAATQGLLTLDPAFVDSIVPNIGAAQPQLPEPLTPRELEVLQLLAQGLANKTIAHHLNISEHTVKFHVNAIMSKLAAQSRTQAVVKATQLGLVLL